MATKIWLTIGSGDGLLPEVAKPLLKPMLMHHTLGSGGRLNKKDGLTRYGNSHVKDKTS